MKIWEKNRFHLLNTKTLKPWIESASQQPFKELSIPYSTTGSDTQKSGSIRSHDIEQEYRRIKWQMEAFSQEGQRTSDYILNILWRIKSEK